MRGSDGSGLVLYAGLQGTSAFAGLLLMYCGVLELIGDVDLEHCQDIRWATQVYSHMIGIKS